jgi:hypothetical protein
LHKQSTFIVAAINVMVHGDMVPSLHSFLFSLARLTAVVVVKPRHTWVLLDGI